MAVEVGGHRLGLGLLCAPPSSPAIPGSAPRHPCRQPGPHAQTCLAVADGQRERGGQGGVLLPEAGHLQRPHRPG